LIREPNLPDRWLNGIGNDDCDCISCALCIVFLGQGEITQCHDVL
jgi:hypothetical protein